MTHDDETVERVARAIYEAQPDVFTTGTQHTAVPWDQLAPYFKIGSREVARAALSAMPPRELLREALEALTEMLRHSGVADAHAMDKFGSDHEAERRARAAADKIRAALTQEKQT